MRCEIGLSGGVVFSPGFPNDYGLNRSCRINITVCYGKWIQLLYKEHIIVQDDRVTVGSIQKFITNFRMQMLIIVE